MVSASSPVTGSLDVRDGICKQSTNFEYSNQENDPDVDNWENDLDVDNRENDLDVDNRENDLDVDNRENDLDVDNRENDLDVDNRENDLDVDNQENKLDVGNQKNKLDVGNQKNKLDVGNQKNKPGWWSRLTGITSAVAAGSVKCAGIVTAIPVAARGISTVSKTISTSVPEVAAELTTAAQGVSTASKTISTSVPEVAAELTTAAQGVSTASKTISTSVPGVAAELTTAAQEVSAASKSINAAILEVAAKLNVMMQEVSTAARRFSITLSGNDDSLMEKVTASRRRLEAALTNGDRDTAVSELKVILEHMEILTSSPSFGNSLSHHDSVVEDVRTVLNDLQDENNNLALPRAHEFVSRSLSLHRLRVFFYRPHNAEETFRVLQTAGESLMHTQYALFPSVQSSFKGFEKACASTATSANSIFTMSSSIKCFAVACALHVLPAASVILRFSIRPYTPRVSMICGICGVISCLVVLFFCAHSFPKAKLSSSILSTTKHPTSAESVSTARAVLLASAIATPFILVSSVLYILESTTSVRDFSTSYIVLFTLSVSLALAAQAVYKFYPRAVQGREQRDTEAGISLGPRHEGRKYSPPGGSFLSVDDATPVPSAQHQPQTLAC